MSETTAYRVTAEQLLIAVLRRWKLVLAATLAGLAASAFLAFSEEPSYEAIGKLMVTAERAQLAVSPDPKSGAFVGTVSDKDLNSEVALLQSPTLLREVLEPYRAEIEAESAPTVVDRLRDRLSGLLRQLTGAPKRPAPTAFDHFVDKVAAHLEVTAIKASNLIDIRYIGGNPEWAARFVNQLAQRHVDRHAETKRHSAALEFFETQRALLADRVRDAEAAMSEFSRREGVEATSAHRTALRARLAEIEAALTVAQIELAEAQAGREVPRAAMLQGSTDAAATTSDPLQPVRARVIELQLQRADLASRLAPTSLKLQMLDQQIAEAQRLLAAESRRLSQERVGGARARVAALTAQVDSYRDKLRHLDQIAPEAERLEQELVTARESYLTYSKKVEEARFSSALDQSQIVNVSIVEKATPATMPLPSRQGFTLMMGLIMSLGLGLGLALLLDRMDPTVETAADVEQITGFRILAEIPLRETA